MKFRYRLKFAVDNMCLHSSKIWEGILLNTITLLILSVVILIMHTSGNFYNETQKAYKEDIKNIGMVHIENEEDYEKCLKFIEYMKTQKYIKMLGTMEDKIENGDSWRTVAEKQANNKEEKDELYNSNSYVETWNVSKDMFSMLSINLEAGYITIDDALRRGYEAVYVGFQYKKMLHIGDVIELNGCEKQGIIAGYIKRNQVIPVMDITEVNKYSIHTTTSLDYGVIEVNETEAGYWNLYFCVNHDYTFDDAKNRLNMLADRENISISVKNLAAVMSSVESSTKDIRRYLLELFFIVAISACVSLTCYQSMQILTRKYEYGILYANGWNQKDIISIILIEIIWKMLIAIILVIPVVALLAKYFFEAVYESQRILTMVIYKNVLVMNVLAGAFMIMLSSVIPIRLIKNHSGAELIGDEL